MRLLSRVSLAIIAFAFLPSCKKQDSNQSTVPDAENYSSKVAVEWMQAFRSGVQSEGVNSPQASRIYAYAAIGLYQSVMPGMAGYKSLEGQVSGLNNLPQANSFGKLDYTVSANEALYQIYANIFGTLQTENVAIMENLHKKYVDDATGKLAQDVITNSTNFGKMVAAAVIDRANNDNFAATRTLTYEPPTNTLNASYWTPTSSVTSPTEPYWGSLKCFALSSSNACNIPSSVPFSTVPGTPFFMQAYELLNTVNNISPAQRDITLWWSDEAGATSTSAGHWVSIAGIVATQKNIDLGKAAEMYVLLNMSLADAFISSWDAKYKLNLLRPVSYIRTYFPGYYNWNSSISTPPSPEYPSGHAVSSGAAADMLTKIFGDVAFTDNANVSLGLAPHTYNSFTEAANEAGISGLYGGVQLRNAIVNGLTQGKEVSKALSTKIQLR